MSFEHPGDGKRCDHCNRPGTPYKYKGRKYSGLFANRGEKLCSDCLEYSRLAEINEPVGWAQVPAHQYVTPWLGRSRS
ncbi:hypothetical protein ACFV1N_46945 [Streptosporangium canum]|uniref:hypothetical protein n=1 Tax=Streptosporangium canum TaxID=324952 RepID=UPI0036790471